MKRTMRAAVINKFGGPGEIVVAEIPIPEVGPNQVLIRVEYAGVGQWDTFEREGGYAEMLGSTTRFPYVLGSEGAGIVVSAGENVSRFKAGDRVFASGFLNPAGGFYAEFAAVDADYVSVIPPTLTVQEASVLAGVGLTALRGLVDVLKLTKDEAVLIFGAGGGIGHVAVQIAKKIGARVFAVASHDDGVDLVRKLGTAAVVDGRKEGCLAEARSYGFDEFDAALLTAGGPLAETTLNLIRRDGRAAYPNGVNPQPHARSGITVSGYNGEPDHDIMQRLLLLAESGAVRPHIDKVFRLEEAADAHRRLTGHYLGKLALKLV